MFISDVLGSKSAVVVKAFTTDSVGDAVRKLAQHKIGALVVEDAFMHPTGIFSERDFINAVAKSGEKVLDTTVQQWMSSPIVSCRPSDRIDAALGLMTMRRIRHLPVMEGETLRGIVSIGDLIKHRLDEKELEANVLLELARRRS
ncbi:MAG: CBS domain-containing protein [Acidisphaera sp.]|nr:CBS domain-containing protein [Acidisphaera sp.]MBV9811854.1 CBS domain-containing protein [Acetobacteraceae bacterium]